MVQTDGLEATQIPKTAINEAVEDEDFLRLDMSKITLIRLTTLICLKQSLKTGSSLIRRANRHIMPMGCGRGEHAK